jgi:hypothetical protein
MPNTRRILPALIMSGVILVATRGSSAADPASDPLAVGVAQHAFDHLGDIAEQADTVAATGGTVIYATGCGGIGYGGLPPADEMTKVLKHTSDYNRHAREKGISVILGYVCATSIVKLDTFDKNWTPEFRGRFKTPPAAWRQQGPDGKPLPSWYGGQYHPACMNNPDWRQYEMFIVRQQLESGHDGIFFDNPTVHPQGCYCPSCMDKFSAMLVVERVIPAPVTVEEARQLVAKHPKQFLRFRATTGRDFLQFIRDNARKVNPKALITCNNSLNAPNVLYAQAQTYGYNLFEMTKAEDLLVVEDMATQPRMLPGGRTVEYGPTYEQLKALSRGLPVVANVLAEADNHTPPNLARLAMAEAAAHGASYLMWPTWPEPQRKRMAATIRPQADFQREHVKLLNGAEPRRDVTLFLPFRQWVESKRCVASELAAKLSAANIQYGVVTEDDLVRVVTPAPGSIPAGGIRTAAGTPVKRVFLVESRSVLQPAEVEALAKFERAGGLLVAADEGDWRKTLDTSLSRSLELTGPPTVRAVVRDQPGRTIVHLYNLAIERLSSFDDKVTPATGLSLRVRVPMANAKTVRGLSADAGTTKGELTFETDSTNGDLVVNTKLEKLEISAVLVIER